MKIERYQVRGQTKYRFRAYVGVDPLTGDKIRIRGSGYDSKREAQLACAEMMANKAPAKVHDVTYRQMYELWLESYRLKVKASTLRNTEQVFRDHILPSFGSHKIKDISTFQCQQWANDQAKKADAAPKRYAYLAKIFDFAVRQGVINSNPAALVDRPTRSRSSRSHRSESNVYSKEELHQFMELCQERLPFQWYVFFRLLAYSGMRRGEALALTWADINKQEHTIQISKTVTRGSDGAYISETPKTDKSNRIILIDATTLKLIQALPTTSDFIFPNSKGSFTAQSVPVKMMHKAVDGSDLRYISPHGLRHTHCSLLFSAGVSIPEVQDRLGHTDVKTTIDVYNHVYQQDKQKALDRFMVFLES